MIYGPRRRAGVAFAPLWAAAPVELSVPQGLRGGAATGVTGGAAVFLSCCVSLVSIPLSYAQLAALFFIIDERG